MKVKKMNKMELYTLANKILDETNDLENFNYDFQLMIIGVRYKNNTYVEYFVDDMWDVKDKYVEYIKNHGINEIESIFIADMDIGIVYTNIENNYVIGENTTIDNIRNFAKINTIYI